MLVSKKIKTFEKHKKGIKWKIRKNQRRIYLVFKV